MARDYDRRRVLKGLGTVGIAGLAGCAGNQEEGQEDTPTSTPSGQETTAMDQETTAMDQETAQPSTEILFHDRDPLAEEYAVNFDESHENISVEPNIEAPTARYKGLIAQISAGNAPDVLGLDVVRIAQFVELGALTDLTDWLQNLEYYDDIFQPIREDFVTYDGKSWGAPQWLDLSMMYYNKSHFEEAGLDPEDPPTTWAEFKDALRALSSDSSADNALGASFVGGLSEFFGYPYLWANGAEFLNEDQTQTGFDSPEAAEALQFWVDIQNDPEIDSTDLVSAKWTNFHNQFVNRNQSILFSGGGAIGQVRNKNPDLLEDMGVAMFPKPEGGKQQTFIGGNSIVIPRQTQQNQDKFEAAKEFVRWTNAEPGMETTINIGYFPGRQTGFNLPAAQEQPNKRLFEPFGKALDLGHAPPIHPKYEQIVSPIRTAFAQALQQKQTPEEALSAAASKINNVLQR